MVIQELLILVQTAGVIAVCMVVIKYAGGVVAALRGDPPGTAVNVWIGNERGQGEPSGFGAAFLLSMLLLIAANLLLTIFADDRGLARFFFIT